MLKTLAAAAFAAFVVSPVHGQAWNLVPAGTEFQRIDDRTAFLRIITDRGLKRFGIRLEVQPDGRILGRAFGRDVTGAWQWRDGYFCREMAWGARRIAPNCQEVKVSGNMLRFTSDRGTGDFADLRLH